MDPKLPAILRDHRLVFVTGKGGVGKSTATAALGAALARDGRRVLVVETDTYSAMAGLLGFQRAEDVVQVRERLWAINLRSADSLVATLARYVPSERVVRTVTQNRVTRAFFESAPSVNEFVLLDQILVYVDDPRFDVVVVDLPASGHAVTFLGVPKTLGEMMRGVGPIAKRASEVHQMIADARRTAVVAVCLPEEMPVNETIELADNLEAAIGRGLDLALVNMVHRAPLRPEHRPLFEALSARAGTDHDPAELLSMPDLSSPVTRLVAGNALALRWHDRDEHYLRVLHDRLDAAIIEIPMFYEVEDIDIVERVTGYLCGSGDGSDDDRAAS